MRSQNVLTFVAALTATTLLYGCGGGTTVTPTTNSSTTDETHGWLVQVSHYQTSGWTVVVPGSAKLYVGDQIDLDLVWGPTLGRNRGGYDLEKKITLPNGTVVGNEAFGGTVGKGGYVLPMAGEYTLSVSAAASGSPHASLTCMVYDKQVVPPVRYDLTAHDPTTGVALPNTLVGDRMIFTGETESPIRFVMGTSESIRGGLSSGETTLRISFRDNTGMAPSFDLGPNDPTVVTFHQSGDFQIDALIGLANGTYDVLASCWIGITTPQAYQQPRHIVIDISPSLKAQAAAAGVSIDTWFGQVDGGGFVTKTIIDDSLILPGLYNPGPHHLEGQIDGHGPGGTYVVRRVDRTVTVLPAQDLIVVIE